MVSHIRVAFFVRYREERKKESHHHHNFPPAAAAAVSIQPPPPTTTERAGGVTCSPGFFLRLFISRHTHSLPFPSSFSFFRTAPPWQPAARAIGRWEKGGREGLSLRFERDLSLSPFSPSFLAALVGWLKGGGEKEEEGLPVLRTKLNRCCDSDPPVYQYTKKKMSPLKRKCLPVHLGDGRGRKNQRLCTYTDADWNFLRCLLPSSRRRTFSGEIGGRGGENLKTSTRSTFVCREKKNRKGKRGRLSPEGRVLKKVFFLSS